MHTNSIDIDLQHHINFIHHKAVKHGHVLLVKDWPHSTFHKYVTQGLVDENWGGADEKGCLVSNLVKWCANKS